MREIIEKLEDIENLYKNGSNAPYQPLPKGQFGYLGVLLSHKVTGLVQCHICGKWFASLGKHVSASHKITSAKYRSKFGFSSEFPLCSEENSRRCRINTMKRIKEGKFGPRFLPKMTSERGKKYCKKRKIKGWYSPGKVNERNLCHDQIIKRVLMIADNLGHFPSSEEISNMDQSLLTAILRRYKTWNQFKISETEESINKYMPVYGRDKIIFLLRKYADNHKGPIRKYIYHKNRTKEYPSIATIYRYLGSWNRALQMAGLIGR